MPLFKHTIIAIACACSLQSTAQTKAITENGEEVILYTNGTWKSTAISPAYDTRLDTLKYFKSKMASFQVKSTINQASVWINPKVWSLQKRNENENAAREYTFLLKTGSAYALLVSEQIEIPINNLAEIALNNMKAAALEAHKTREEYRMVNGNLVKYMETEAIVSGINFVYFGYYYSNSKGTTQLLGYTAKSLLAQHKEYIEELLNGFDLQDK